MKFGGLSVTEAHTKVQIGTQKNVGWWNCEMADYLHSLAIQGNLFHNSMPDKTAWRINEYSLYNNIVFGDMLNLIHNECLLSNWKSEEVTSIMLT